MMPKLNHPSLSLPGTFAFIAMMLSFSCAPKDIYEGIYKAEGGSSHKYCNSQIELMERGLAVWRVPEDEVSFRWDIKDSEIWLSTKSGGIIIGKIDGDVIEMQLPGISSTCCFKKVPVE